MDNSDNQDQPKFITHADLNGALASQKKDFQKMINQMQEAQTAFLQNLAQSQGQAKEDKTPLPTKAELSEDTAELKRQLKILLDRDKQRDETEKKSKLTNSLKETLGRHGINSKADIALKYLQDQVRYDEDGQLVMRYEDVPGVPMEFPLHEGIAKFAQSEHGKFLADPRNDARGAGSGNMNMSQRAPVSNIPINPMTGEQQPRNAKDLKAMLADAMSKGSIIR